MMEINKEMVNALAKYISYTITPYELNEKEDACIRLFLYGADEYVRN